MTQENRGKVIFFLVVIVSLLSAFYIIKIKNKDVGDKSSSGSLFGGKKITLNIIGKTGSSEDFFEIARKDYMAKNSNIEINYIAKSTFEAVDFINKGNDIDAWLSADETGADLLKDNYEKEHNGENVIVEFKPIVTSPLVIVGWEERLKVLGDVNIASLYELVSKGNTWQTIGGKSDWGFFNFSHTDAIASNSGLQFITLLIHNYYEQKKEPKKNLTIEDVANANLVEYIRKFEKNTSKQEEGSGKFIQSFILYGPSRYDLGAIYEYYALSNMKSAQGRWGNLKIVYPNPTIWSNKPFIVLKGPKSTKEKIDASKGFMEYLLSVDMQKKAMKEGYRPANPAITDLSALDADYGQFGYKKDIPPAVPAPDINVVESLRSLVQRIK